MERGRGRREEGGSLRTRAPARRPLLQSIYAKGVVCIALRALWDEELFVDHALNPYNRRGLPAWYRPLDEMASKRTWKGIAAR